MTLVKCPRCELNYITDDEKLCTVCRREVRGDVERDDLPELCSECNEQPAVPGGELCVLCMKELGRRAVAVVGAEPLGGVDEPQLGIDPVSTMDEIDIELVDPIARDDVDDMDDDEEAEDPQDAQSDILLSSLEDADDEDDEDE